MGRTLSRLALVVATVSLVVGPLLPAAAVTQASFSNEIGGTSAAAHLTAQNLRSAWLSQVAANGGTASAPMMLTQPTYTNGAAVSGVINTAADGTTTSVARTRYTGGANPTFAGASPNPGTATCTTSGTSLQGGAPRPTTLESNAACSVPGGFAYAEVGGPGENTTRDAVEFTFSRPVLGFGAWFGDLETRTDGGGEAAVVRLYGPGDVLLSDQQVQPGANYLPQSNCSNTYTGCGNNTTRWLGFVADPALPVVRMVVIVGDDDVNGSGFDEGMGFIGPTIDLTRATISLAKTADPLTDTNADGVVGAGDTVHYNFSVTNTGTIPVSTVGIADPGATGLTCPGGPLAPAAVRTCTGTHVLTQAQVNSGSLTNTATASATAYAGTITSNPSTLVLPIPSVPGLTLTKSVAEPTYDSVGDVLHFHLTAANTGNVTLTGLSVADPNPGTGAYTSNCPALTGTLAPGASVSCDVTYAITQADLDAGTLTNAAAGSATAPGGVGVGPVAASATSSAVQQVALGLSKSVDEPTYDAVGDVLTYTLTATNNGNVTLTDVDVTDPAPGAGAFVLDCAGLPTNLAPGADGTCTATYVVTQQDLDDGVVTNVAGATAGGPAGSVSAPDAEVTSTAITQPGLGIIKVVDEPTYDAVGDVLTYTVTVTNTSNVTEHAVTVDDPAPGDGDFDLDCAALPATLAPGASGTCTASYTVTQADIDSGSVTNSADASALLPNNAVVDSPTAAASSNADQSASLSLIKTVDATTYDSVGDVLTYDIAVTNAGNVTLDGVDVADTNPGTGSFDLDCPALPATLAPGDDEACTATYTVTQADLDAGSVVNTASAGATSPGGPIGAPDSVVTSTAQQTADLTVTKTVDATEYDAPGDVLTYAITVANAGNVTLTGVNVTDVAPGAGAFDLDCGPLPVVLAPGDDVSCTATYEVTQADLDDGSVTNSAETSAVSPTGPISVSSLPVTSLAQQSASLDLVKTVDAPTYDSVGDVLTYEIVLTNTGNVTLDGVEVSDPNPGSGSFDLDCPDLPAALGPGDDSTCTAEYTVTQADIDGSRVTNTASAQGGAPGGALVVSPDAEATSTSLGAQGAGLTVTKTVDEAGYAAVGDVLTYAIGVVNTGIVTLSSVAVTDAAPGTGVLDLDCSLLPGVLAPGANGTCTATYEVTQADIDAGSVTNIAEANASPPSPNDPISIASAPVTSLAQQQSALTLVKTVDAATYDTVGDVLTYEITATNDGNVTLDALTLDDAAPGSGAFDTDCATLPTQLTPGDSETCTATYAVNQADLDRGSVVNRARAEAVDPDDNPEVAEASVTSMAETTAELSLDKTVDERTYAAAGDVLHYTITARNIGNVTLRQLRIVDAAPGSGSFTTDCRTVATLAPGADRVCHATYTVTASDLTRGRLTNTARAAAPGQVAAVTASATSTSEGAELPSTGAARSLTALFVAGLGLLAGGLVLTALGIGRRNRFRA